MNTTSRTCACRGQETPIGKCYRCGNLICERCVVFLAGQAVCNPCARNHEETIMIDVSRARRNSDFVPAEVEVDERTVQRQRQRRKLMRTLNKGFEHACMLLVIVGFLLSIFFFGHIMDFASSYAVSTATNNRQNPLARLVIGFAAQTNVFYQRHDSAIGHALTYMELYPKDEKLADYHYAVGSSFLLKKEFRLARQFLTSYTELYPNHPLREDALDRIGIVDRALAVSATD